MSTNPGTSSGVSTARVLSILGIVFAALAILFFPIIFGPAGIILGFVANAKGDKPFGMWVGIAAIVATIVGMTLGYLVYTSA